MLLRLIRLLRVAVRFISMPRVGQREDSQRVRRLVSDYPADQYLDTVAPVATPTPIPNIWDAPATSVRGLAALVAGMLVVMVVALGLTSGSKWGASP
jgi:hypothetical protein